MIKLIVAFFIVTNLLAQSKIHISDALSKSYHEQKFKRFKIKEKSNLIETDTAFFYVRNIIDQSKWDKILFYRIANNAKSNIWLELNIRDSYKKLVLSKLELFNQFVENKSYTNSIDSSKGLIDLSHDLFGQAPNIDQDDKLDILLVDVRDNFNINAAYVAGFFDPMDQTNERFSNKKDIIYIDIYPGLIYQDTILSTNEALATLAHEYQHLINFNYETKPEITFLNEGLSELSEYLHGFPGRDPYLYLSAVNTNFLSWGKSNNILIDYQRASLFHYYLFEKYGLTFIRQLCQSEKIGFDSYQFLLKKYQRDLKNEVFDFHLTNLLNQNSDDFNYNSDRAKRYQTKDIQVIRNLPFVQNNTLEAGAIIIYEGNENIFEKLQSKLTAKHFVAKDNSKYLIYYNDNFQEAIPHKIEIFDITKTLPIQLRLDDGNPDFIHSTVFLLKNSALESGFQINLKNIAHDISMNQINIYGLFDSEIDGKAAEDKIQFLEIKNDANEILYQDSLIWKRNTASLNFEKFHLKHEILLKANQYYHVLLRNLNQNFFNIALDKHQQKSQSYILSRNKSIQSFEDANLDAHSLKKFNVMIYLEGQLEKKIHYKTAKLIATHSDSILITLDKRYQELKIIHSYPTGSESLEIHHDNLSLTYKKNTLNKYLIEAKKSLNEVDIYEFSYALFDHALIDVNMNGFNIRNYSNTRNEFELYSFTTENENKLDIKSKYRIHYSVYSDLDDLLYLDAAQWKRSSSSLFSGSNSFRLISDTLITSLRNINPSYSISTVYPNPSLKTSSIKLLTEDETRVDLSVYSSIGKKIYSKSNMQMKEMNHTILLNWKKMNVASGIYFITITLRHPNKTTQLKRKAVYIKN